MYRVSSLRCLLIGLSLALATACSDYSSEQVTSEEPSIKPQNEVLELKPVDFAYEFRRTDEIEICVRERQVEFDRELGVDYISAEYSELGCKCHRDYLIDALADVEGATPEMQNMIVQMALNLEVRPLVFGGTQRPNSGFDAFSDFMTDEVEAEFGFSYEEFERVINSVNLPDDSDMGKYIDSLKGISTCAASYEYASTLLPGVPEDKLRFVGEYDVALQRLRYDNSIDLNQLDFFLYLADPDDVCSELVEDVIEIERDRGVEYDGVESAPEVCKLAMDRIAATADPDDESEPVFQQRTFLALMYLEANRKTAKRGDLLYYMIGGHDAASAYTYEKIEQFQEIVYVWNNGNQSCITLGADIAALGDI